jgi:hypothetical protein
MHSAYNDLSTYFVQCASRLQVLGAGSVVCKHADDEEITAVCCLQVYNIKKNDDRTDRRERMNVVVTATTARGTHSLHVWHIRNSQAEFDEQGRQINPKTYTIDQPVYSVRAARPNAIKSICASETSLYNVDFATCSAETGPVAHVDRGIIKPWSSREKQLAVSVTHFRNGNEDGLRCEASVSKVIITVNRYGYTLIAASYTARYIGIELWNITTGTYNKWDAGNDILLPPVGRLASSSYSLMVSDVIQFDHPVSRISLYCS